MPVHIFISYPKEDQRIADAIRSKLAINGITCWIATADIPPGAKWAEAIFDAISSCAVFIFVHSANTSRADHALNELSIASNNSKPIIVFRVDGAPISKEVHFFATRYQWFDATSGPLEKHLRDLAHAVQRLTLPQTAAAAPTRYVDVPKRPVHVSPPMIAATRLALRCPRDLPLYDDSHILPSLYDYCSGRLFVMDESVSRPRWPSTTLFTPRLYLRGLLAERWEVTDSHSLTVTLRKGTKWYIGDTARAFTARDVVHHYTDVVRKYKSVISTGVRDSLLSFNPKTVTALDDNTVLFVFEHSAILGINYLTAPLPYNTIIPPEVSGSSSLQTDWRIAAHIGHWILSDLVPGSSVTFVKDTRNWATHDLQTDRALRPVQSLKLLVIPNLSTSLAALRTGKIDMLDNVPWRDAKATAASNPDIIQASCPTAGLSLELRCDAPPFNDIRVRKALQMAIDRKAIASSCYGDTTDGTPAGLVNPSLEGWCIPYSEWPEALRNEYSYDPTEAKRLLAAAGYPNGFIVSCVVPVNADLDTIQAVVSHFRDIGVDMPIRPLELSVFYSSVASGTDDQVALSNLTGSASFPPATLGLRNSRSPLNHTHSHDANYDAMLADIDNANSFDTLAQKVKDADLYALGQHWAIQICPISNYTMWQPYLKGYNGDVNPQPSEFTSWQIDVNLKQSLGF